MPKPKDITETVLGCHRRTNGKGRTVLLVHNENGQIDKQYSSIAEAKGINGKYYIFSFPEALENIVGSDYVLGALGAFDGFVFNSFLDAEDKYIELADSKTGKIRKKWEADNSKMLVIDGEYS